MAEVRQQLIDDLQYLGGIFQEVENGFSEADYSDDLAEFLPVLRGDHEEMFSGEHDSTGSGWEPLAESTIQRKGHDIILFEKGHLKESLISDGGAGQIAETSDRHLAFGTEVEYAGYHQSGTSRMPARPPVGLREDTLDEIVETVADRTIESLKG